MRINNNIMAMNTYRQLGITNNASAKSMEKLSSGYRINRAGDDAAGLSISEKMRAQIKGLTMSSKNAQDGISLIQTAEGALNETHAILQRMRELAVQASNDTNESVDRDAIAEELSQLTTEITRIAETTQFNQKTLLDGSLNATIANIGTNLTAANGISNIKISGASVAAGYELAVDTGDGTMTLTLGTESQTVNYGGAPTEFETKNVTFGAFGITVTINSQIADISANNTFDITATGSISLLIGANEGENMTISINDMRASAFTGLETIDVSDAASAEAAVTTINDAIELVSAERSKLGAYQNRLEHTIKNLDNTAENLQAAESRIRDVDMAKEMMEFTKQNILVQAATAMLAQANQAPQGVLQLLR